MNYLPFALKLAHKAGDIMHKHFTIGVQKESKEDLTPLTIADTQINELTRKAVREDFPEHGFLGEEGGSFNQNAEYVWLCDPIDGTIPFAHGIPLCCYTLALVRNGKPIFGILYDPFQKRLWRAELGKGAYCNNKKIKVSQQRDVTGNSINYTAWDAAPYWLPGFFDAMVKERVFVMALAASVYGGALVASGELIANVWPGSTPWDIAAQKIIVEEAGGKVTDLFGEEQLYNTEIRGAIVSNGTLHNRILSTISACIQKK
ncbi:MAG: inositol monophosphatase [Patescibacteria group bacterium]|nr:inositol monophosphatase [Patescibacteria group bacterium]